MKGRIFVSIASYRDPELGETLRSLFSQASRPDLLTVAIFHQSEEPAPHVQLPRGARLIRDGCHPAESLGACWARSRVQQKMDGEEYFLQVDAHHLFQRRWDSLLRNTLDLCPAARPVLTTYLPGYDPRPGRPRRLAPASTAMQFSHFDQDGVILYRSYSYRWELPLPPQPCRFFSGHFAFARREFVESVPYDPELYFFGEESTMAARAFTHGFDLFHPGRTVAWHQYGRDKQPRHWNDEHHPPGGTASWREMQQRGVAKYRRIFCLLPHINSRDGLGTRRTLAEYEAWAGVDHYRQLIHSATAAMEPPSASVSPDWAVRERLLTRAKLFLPLPKLAKVDARPCREVHVAVLDGSSRDAAAYRFSPAEYRALQKAPWPVQVRYRMPPLRLIVWPLLENDTWGEKFEVGLGRPPSLIGSHVPERPKTPARRAPGRRSHQPRTRSV